MHSVQDLVQHLESIVIHWTRQIKDVVNNHDNALSAEILGPLEEIEVGTTLSFRMVDRQNQAIVVHRLKNLRACAETRAGVSP